jgi:hypothetical protein
VRRRAYDEKREAQHRSPAPKMDPDNGNATDAVLRLQSLAGNIAVNAALAGKSVQRDSAPAEAPAKKTSAVTVTLEGYGAIPAESFQFTGISKTGGARNSGPTGFIVSRKVDEHSADLMRMATDGGPIPKVVATFGGQSFELTNVMVSGFSVGSGDEPLESVTFEGGPEKEK